MKTPDDKRITLAFHSEMVERAELRWRARLTFEPGSGDESLAALVATDLEENPIEEGVFEIAGKLLPVKDGRAAIRCGDFVKGKHFAGISLRRRGMDTVRGGLTFG